MLRRFAHGFAANSAGCGAGIMTGGWAFALGLWFAMGLAQGAAAQGFALGETVQNAAILTVDSDRLFSRSAFGLRISQELQDESAALEAENRRIEA